MSILCTIGTVVAEVTEGPGQVVMFLVKKHDSLPLPLCHIDTSAHPFKVK